VIDEEVPFLASVRLVSGTATVALHGEVDLATATQLRHCLAQALALSPKRLVIDMTDLRFIDASGLPALFWAASQLGPHSVVLRSPNYLATRLFTITGLDQVCLVESF
jgi:anti-sigma B factor antagonist